MTINPTTTSDPFGALRAELASQSPAEQAGTLEALQGLRDFMFGGQTGLRSYALEVAAKDPTTGGAALKKAREVGQEAAALAEQIKSLPFDPAASAELSDKYDAPAQVQQFSAAVLGALRARGLAGFDELVAAAVPGARPTEVAAPAESQVPLAELPPDQAAKAWRAMVYRATGTQLQGGKADATLETAVGTVSARESPAVAQIKGSFVLGDQPFKVSTYWIDGGYDIDLEVGSGIGKVSMNFDNKKAIDPKEALALWRAIDDAGGVGALLAEPMVRDLLETLARTIGSEEIRRALSGEEAPPRIPIALPAGDPATILNERLFAEAGVEPIKNAAKVLVAGGSISARRDEGSASLSASLESRHGTAVSLRIQQSTEGVAGGLVMIGRGDTMESLAFDASEPLATLDARRVWRALDRAGGLGTAADDPKVKELLEILATASGSPELARALQGEPYVKDLNHLLPDELMEEKLPGVKYTGVPDLSRFDLDTITIEPGVTLHFDPKVPIEIRGDTLVRAGSTIGADSLNQGVSMRNVVVTGSFVMSNISVGSFSGSSDARTVLKDADFLGKLRPDARVIGPGTVVDNAVIESSAKVGAGVRIERGAQIGASAHIEDQVQIATKVQIGASARIRAGATIGHDAEIGASAEIGAGATIGARVEVGASAKVGEGATVGEGSELGASSKVRDGANVPPGTELKNSGRF